MNIDASGVGPQLIPLSLHARWMKHVSGYRGQLSDVHTAVREYLANVARYGSRAVVLPAIVGRRWCEGRALSPR